MCHGQKWEKGGTRTKTKKKSVWRDVGAISKPEKESGKCLDQVLKFEEKRLA